MRLLKNIMAAALLALVTLWGKAQPGSVASFKKVIVSPYIQVTFVQGEKEGVTVNDMVVDSSKLHVEVDGGTLRLYLEGAKEVPHNKHVYNNDGGQNNYHPYPNHAVVATVTYKSLDDLSLRGEETHVCSSPLNAAEFTLHMYGTCKMVFAEAHIGELHTTMYGASTLDINTGAVDEQYYTCYGEGKINTAAIGGRTCKLTAYGEAEFNLNVSDRIKITAFGEAKLRYKGNPDIVKGLHFGALDLKKID
jgi:Putative auto-transporter adhesin, head GIN domain